MNLLFSAAIDLALHIAPELASGPLYVTGLPADYPHPACRAWAMRRVDGLLQASLVARGEWRGQGSAIVFVDDLDSEDFIGTLIHEVAHLLPFSPAIDSSTVDVTGEETAIAAWAGESSTEPTRCPQHGPDFIRACVHLQYRAAAVGAGVPFPAIVAGWHYCLPPLVQFVKALDNEPQRLVGESFTNILALPAPPRFTNLFGA